ncbi:MAG: nitronate monooxygenase, partial [Candidatus Omnitrophota bacterium]
MRCKDYLFWVTLPPCSDDLGLLKKSGGLAEPLIDLRYGSDHYRRFIIKKAVYSKLSGLTLFVDCRDQSLIDFLLNALPQGSRIIFVSVDQSRGNIQCPISKFNKRGVGVGIEVDSKDNAKMAVSAGADFIVASGNEACGPVSQKTSLILIQEILEGLDIPLVIRGGLGPQGAAAAMVAGCSGCILDTQVLLVYDSPLSRDLKECLSMVSPCDTSVVGDILNCSYRLLCIGSQDEYLAIVNREREIFLQDMSDKDRRAVFEKSLVSLMAHGVKEEAAFLP